MLRREVLAGLMGCAALPMGVRADQLVGSEPGLRLGQTTPFDADTVRDLARSLAAENYRPPISVPEAWTSITYDQYQKIWFDGRNAVWTGEEDTPLRLDFFPPGLFFPHPIDVAVVESGEAREVLFDLAAFDTTDQFPDLPIDDTLGFSGLRLRAETEQMGIFQEFAVFQGASYFRAIGRGEIYGLSARGLAIDTAEPTGEEFPDFRAFWVEKPAPSSKTFVVHALLDSPRCTGAYRFEITLGLELVMAVEAEIYPREVISHIGIAPLTSMFQYDETNRERFSDYRPAVHDSDGLLILNGAGETLWRPLANPQELQISAFRDDNPQGFGLMQRARDFSDFADLEALYHRRPGLWIEPGEGWGRGAVTLVEIPTDREVYDNIVCYWRPDGGLAAGEPHTMRYRMRWGERSDFGNGLRVLNTSMGDSAFGEGIIAVIDFEAGAEVPDDLGTVDKLIRASAGTVSEGVLQRNPETGGPRLAFTFVPGEARLVEFRAQLRMDGEPLSEVWLYRWTA